MFTNLLDNTGSSMLPSLMLKSEKLAYNSNDANNFVINGTPNTDAAILFVVNGLIYFDESDVTYNSATKTFTWNNKEITLSGSDRIMALYSESV